jgi:hypothetical protein
MCSVRSFLTVCCLLTTVCCLLATGCGPQAETTPQAPIEPPAGMAVTVLNARGMD